LGFLIFLIFIPVFYLLIIRPQQQQRRTHQGVVSTLEVGQRVMTVGGLMGTLTRVDAETVTIDAGDGVLLTYGRTFIRQQVDFDPTHGDAQQGDQVHDHETGMGADDHPGEASA
jgi:preprotein translocase subunit YajC